MSRFRKFTKAFRDWSPLWLWPLSLFFLASGIFHAVVNEDYARGAFSLIFSEILDRCATGVAAEAFAPDAGRTT